MYLNEKGNHVSRRNLKYHLPVFLAPPRRRTPKSCRRARCQRYRKSRRNAIHLRHHHHLHNRRRCLTLPSHPRPTPRETATAAVAAWPRSRRPRPTSHNKRRLRSVVRHRSRRPVPGRRCHRRLPQRRGFLVRLGRGHGRRGGTWGERPRLCPQGGQLSLRVPPPRRKKSVEQVRRCRQQQGRTTTAPWTCT